jgi:hypothetical protein
MAATTTMQAVAPSTHQAITLRGSTELVAEFFSTPGTRTQARAHAYAVVLTLGV